MNNTLTLICGAPGAGKSTLAKALVGSGYADCYFEADMWMEDSLGNYAFDPRKLGYCHSQCFLAVESALKQGKNVIQSNTNIKKSERNKYLDIAKKLGCKIQLIRVDGEFGSIHNVPEDKVKAMREGLNSEWGSK